MTIEIKKGLISRENKKFEPFKAVWSSKTQSLEVYREGDAGLSLSEFKAGVGTTQPKATTTRTPNGKPTTAPHGTTASGNSGPDGTTTGPDISGMTTETPPDGTRQRRLPPPRNGSRHWENTTSPPPTRTSRSMCRTVPSP